MVVVVNDYVNTVVVVNDYVNTVVVVNDYVNGWRGRDLVPALDILIGC